MAAKLIKNGKKQRRITNQRVEYATLLRMPAQF